MFNFYRSFILMSVLSGFLITTFDAKAQSVQESIAVVNFEQILLTSSAPKSIRSQIQAQRDSYRKEVQKEEADLRAANQALAQKQSLLSPESFQEERRKFEQRVLAVQKKIQQKNITLQKAQSKAQEKVKNALRQVVLKIAQKNGYALVVRRAQVVVVADKMDITKLVITELNKQLPTVKVFGK